MTKLAQDRAQAREFCATTDISYRLILPALSTQERVIMQLNDDARAKFGFELLESGMSEDLFVLFNKFSRTCSHSRVHL